MHADFVAADHATALEHGNLVRGFCPLGLLSQTFDIALGPHALSCYLQNARLDAQAAHSLRLVQKLCPAFNVESVIILLLKVGRDARRIDNMRPPKTQLGIT